ncbi:MAG: hypothetical protein WAM42_15485 [Candidatus Nitrosopolaris sp.]
MLYHHTRWRMLQVGFVFYYTLIITFVETGIGFSIVAIAAIIALFASGLLVATHQAQAFFFLHQFFFLHHFY